MPRIARQKSESGVYHIVLRGLNRQTLFYDDEDKAVFLNRVKLAKDKYNFKLYAFCLMGNHVHILLKEQEQDLARIMRKILSSYVYWYNSKYERIGNLFQDRFKSEPIENDRYLLCAARYIHQNPIKAGLASNISDYDWSSYGTYINKSEGLIDIELVLSLLQTEEGYVEFMSKNENIKFLEPVENFRISDDKLMQKIKSLHLIKNVTEIYSLHKIERSGILKKILAIEGATPYQVSRVTGVPMGVIRGIPK
jgi:REP element-mobilizing transposase RayT